jgi:Cas7 group CRISPR-associated protein Csh2
MSEAQGAIRRATGLLVIEAINSNPNGDPDRESDPRVRPDEHGEISPVSFKRKVRDLVADKEGPVWLALREQFEPPLDESGFAILESRGRVREEIVREIGDHTFLPKYWDGRVFGNTFLEKDKGSSDHLRTGVVQFGLGISLAPVRVERLTTTNKSGVQEGLDRGMAPLGYRVVEHGVYTMPFFVNATAARKTNCTARDIELLLRVIPFAYSHTASYIRTAVEIRHAWYVEHTSALGSASDFDLIASLTPRKKGDPNQPSRSWGDYVVPEGLPEALVGKVVAPIRDLMAELYAAAST